MNAASKLNPFQRYFGLGFRYLVPITPPGALVHERSHLAKRRGVLGKAPGIRRDDGLWTGLKDWQTREPTAEDLTAWHVMGAGVGLRLGPQHDGTVLAGIDADTLHRPSAQLVRAQVEASFGLLPIRIGRSPKAMYLVRLNGTVPYRNLAFDQGVVEILCRGKQCVIDGPYPGQEQPYHFTRPLPALAEMTIFESDRIDALLAALAAALPGAGAVYTEGGGDRANADQQALKGSPDLVRRAMACIPNDFPELGYQEWIKVAAALRGACADDFDLGMDLFEEWSIKGGADPEDERYECPRHNYKSVKAPFAVGASWLYELAEKAGGFSKSVATSIDTSDRWFDATIVQSGEGVAETSALFGGPATKVRPKLLLETFDDVADGALTDAAKPLVKGLLDQGAMSVLYGESNAGKTFVTMDLAYHVAAGLPWGGLRTTAGAVVYVAAEGGKGAAKRAAALKAKHGPCAAFHYLRQPLNLLDPDADLAPLIELLRGVEGLSLVVLDTLSRLLAGGDENSSSDMGAMVRHMDAVRSVTAAHVLVVHHTGKDVARGARGHSLLRAATDTEIEVVPGRLQVTKQRDLDKEFSTGFALEPVTLGTTEDGDVVTSCTVKLTGAPVLREPSKVDRALELIEAGEWRRDPRAGEAWVGVPIALALGLDLADPADKKSVIDTLAQWIADGRLNADIQEDKHRKSRVYVTVNRRVDGLFD